MWYGVPDVAVAHQGCAVAVPPMVFDPKTSTGSPGPSTNAGKVKFGVPAPKAPTSQTATPVRVTGCDAMFTSSTNSSPVSLRTPLQFASPCTSVATAPGGSKSSSLRTRSPTTGAAAEATTFTTAIRMLESLTAVAVTTEL